MDIRSANTAKLPATPIPSSRPTANFSARLPIEHYASEKCSGATSAFQTRLLPPSQPRGRWDLLSHDPKISICSPAQEAALEVRSLTPHRLDSLSLPQVFVFISSKSKPALPSWPSGFVAVFFCFSGVFLRLKPPLLGASGFPLRRPVRLPRHGPTVGLACSASAQIHFFLKWREMSQNGGASCWNGPGSTRSARSNTRAFTRRRGEYS